MVASPIELCSVLSHHNKIDYLPSQGPPKLLLDGLKAFIKEVVAHCRQSVEQCIPRPRSGIAFKSCSKSLEYLTGRTFRMYIMRGLNGVSKYYKMREDYIVVEIRVPARWEINTRSRKHGLPCDPFRKQIL